MRIRSWAFPGLAAVCIMALGACGTIKSIFRPDRPPPVEIVIPPVAPDSGTARPPALPRPKPVAEVPLPTAEDFMGLSLEQVRSMIGKPSLVREEQNVQVWHYRNLDCTLFLFFYPKGAEGYRVNHIDVADMRNDAAPPPGTTPGQAHHQMLESCVASTLVSYGSQRL